MPATCRSLATSGLVTTPWILFTDADVIFESAFFPRAAQHIADDHADAWYDPKISRDQHHAYCRAISLGQRAFDRVGVPAVSGSSLLMRRSAYLAVGGFDPSLTCNEDSELGWRLARQGFAVCFDPALTAFARDHRRLEAGRRRKLLHTALRCSLLYLDLIPRRYRSYDWG